MTIQTTKLKSLSISFNDKQEKLLNKNRWHVSDINLAADKTHSTYYLDFNKISIDWLRQCAKKFVIFQSVTKSLASCKAYITSLFHFNSYLLTLDIIIKQENVNRQLIVGYIEYLSASKLGVVAKQIALINLRTFHQVVLQEEWLSWPERPLIYSSDLPKNINNYPRFIPETVIKQLLKHIVNLPEYLQAIVIVLLETGRRVSEVVALPVDCLEQDSDKDWLLKVYERKMKRKRLLPISAECLKVIKNQQKNINKQSDSTYLFPSRRKDSSSSHITARYINMVLNKLSDKYNIVDDNEKRWQFSSHQFRHTVGTRMINSGVSQFVVQKYLGHESPEMTAKYAYIHDETMKKAYFDFKKNMIDINGEIVRNDKSMLDVQWLKKNITTQALPNGLCGLPLTQNKCPHANACLTCSNFRTSKQYINQHKNQLKETEIIIENANKNGWTRIVEMNTTVKENLTNIIETLEEQENE